MRIVCPQCGYSRDIPADKVPSRSSIATCPKCQFRFRFRGPSAASRPEEGEDPVYPPKPSRPQVEREPYDGLAPGRFEPRTSRLYQPEPQSGHEHGHVPPRPQARWLPDPEPDYPEPEEPVSRPLRARHLPEEPMQPEAGGLEAPWERSGNGGESLKPLDFPGEQPAPWERMGLGEPGTATMASPAVSPRQPVIERADTGPDAPAAPEAGESGHGEDVPAYPGMAPAPDEDMAELQPVEAVAGDDSVRDIWARLQAMGGEAKASAHAPRQEGEPEARAVPIGAETVAPWEQFEHYGVVPAFLATVKNILLKPGDFYDQLPPVIGRARPLIFAMTVCLLAMLAGVVWNYFGMGPNLSELGRTDGFQGLGTGAIGGLALLGLAPLALVAFVFLDASLTHLLLGLLRSASRSFEETFRAVCYAGAPWLLAALPVPYSYLIPVVLIWHMTLQAIGLKKLHRAGYPQVLASVLVKWSLYFMASFAILHVLITRR